MSDPAGIRTAADAVRAILAGRTGTARVSAAEAFAPANIALIKYWGKRDAALNLPVTSSLSLSLGRLGSTVALAPATGRDTVVLNGAALPPDSRFALRLSSFLDLFRPEPGYGYAVTAANTIPTAAGFASSASGFAAVVKALDRLCGWGLDERALSILARLGSGSAARSIYEGLVEWHAGAAADGMDSVAEPLGVEWPDLRIGLVVVTAAEKGLGSREAMQQTVATSPLYREWPALVARDLAELKAALRRRDFAVTGAVAERNALAMHATMLGAAPPVLYWRAESVLLMQRVWALRAGGLPVYFTMDAGPNLKVLFLSAEEERVRDAFHEFTFLSPVDRQGPVTGGRLAGVSPSTCGAGAGA